MWRNRNATLMPFGNGRGDFARPLSLCLAPELRVGTQAFDASRPFGHKTSCDWTQKACDFFVEHVFNVLEISGKWHVENVPHEIDSRFQGVKTLRSRAERGNETTNQE